MSAYGDYLAGLISDYEYTAICRREALEDREQDLEEDEEEE